MFLSDADFTLEVLGAGDMLYTVNGQSYFQSQVGKRFQKISRNDAEGVSLLAASEIDSRPHEVAQYCLRLVDGQTLRSNLIHGTGYTVPIHLNKHAAAIATAIAHAESCGKQVTEILIDHTHPCAGTIEIAKTGHVFVRPFALTDPEDFSLAAKFSMELRNIPVTIRAITPDGLTYAVTFLNGDPFGP